MTLEVPKQKHQRKLSTTDLSVRKLEKGLSYSTLKAILQKEAASLALPAEASMTKFLWQLSRLRKQVIVERKLNRPAYEVNIEVHAAIETFSRHLKANIERLTRDIETFQNAYDSTDRMLRVIASDLSKKRTALELANRIRVDLLACIESGEFVFPIAPQPIFKDRWPMHLSALVNSYQKAMRSTNFNEPLAIHADGPGARVISALIPYVTGENTTPGGVADRWRRPEGVGKRSTKPTGVGV